MSGLRPRIDWIAKQVINLRKSFSLRTRYLKGEIYVQKGEEAEEERRKEKVRRENAPLTYLTGLGCIPRSVLARHCTGYWPKLLKGICERVRPRVLF